MTSVSVGFEGGGELGKRTRRRWSPEEKRRLVALTHQPHASIAGVARDHGLNANLLFNCRRKFDRNELVVAPPAALTFAQIAVVAAAYSTPSWARIPRDGGQPFHAIMGTDSTASWAPLG